MKHLIITVHGIRTYGRWQSRLENLINSGSNKRKAEFAHYKYGVFTLVSFLIPYLRRLAVRRFKNELVTIVEEGQYSSVDIVAHSFGTYLSVEALHQLAGSSGLRIRNLILCGSVVSPDRNLNVLLAKRGNVSRVINDCGTRDGVLLLTLLVFGVGMAGRLGLQGMSRDKLINRFFCLGHSGYFGEGGKDPDAFMRKWWVPVLNDGEVALSDERSEAPNFSDRFWAALGSNGSSVTVSIYAAVLGSLAFSFWSLWADAVEARRTSEFRHASALAALSSIELESGYPATAKKLALHAYNTATSANSKVPPEVWQSLFEASRQDRQIAVFRGQDKERQPLLFNKAGNKLLAVSDDGYPTLLDFGNEKNTIKFQFDRFPYTVGLSDDGSKLLSASNDSYARVTNTTDIADSTDLLPNTQHSFALSFMSTDGRYVVVPKYSGGLYVYDINKPATPAFILDKLPGKSLKSAAFSPDNKWLVMGFDTGKPGLFNLQEQGEVTSLPYSDRWDQELKFNRDGSAILSVDASGGRPQVWNLSDLLNPIELEGHNSPVRTAEFGPEGNKIVTGSEDGIVRIWDAGGAELHVLTGHEGKINHASFHPSGKSVVSASSDGTARIWRIGENRKSVVLRGHRGSVDRATFDPLGRFVATASSDGTIRFWDPSELDGKRIIEGHTGPVNSVSFSPSSALLVTASDDLSARIWDIHDGAISTARFQHDRKVSRAVFDSSGETVFSSSFRDRVFAWQTSVPDKARLSTPASGALAIDPAGDRFATGTLDGILHIWASKEANEPTALSGHTSEISFVKFSPDGKWILSIGNRYALNDPPRVWNSRDSSKVFVLDNLPSNARTGTFDNAGDRVALGLDDGSLVLWDFGTANEPIVTRRHHNTITEVIFSPNGESILTASEDFAASVWDARNLLEPLFQVHHNAPIFAADFHSSAELFATASGKNQDNTVRIWRADGSGEAIILEGHNDIVYDVEFSPDGEWVATASKDNLAILWPIRGLPLIEHACNRLPENKFTRRESQEFALPADLELCK
ncbi:alpha/beta hydrolase [Roseibium album]|uniref:alpha/beta hydrolase n=1 Tax=Roseibium album TaxID=311410 RepID=UPI003BB129C0